MLKLFKSKQNYDVMIQFLKNFRDKLLLFAIIIALTCYWFSEKDEKGKKNCTEGIQSVFMSDFWQ